MDEKVDYKKLLEDAAWNADPDLDYKINFKDEAPNEVILTRGEIVLSTKEIKYSYKFAIGVDGNILFMINDNNELKKRVYEKIITFNEDLARGIGAQRMFVKDEINERVKNLYFHKGYERKVNNSIGMGLEKRLE